MLTFFLLTGFTIKLQCSFSCVFCLGVFDASAKSQEPCGRQRCRHRAGGKDMSAEQETQVREDEPRLAENEKSPPGFAMREGDDNDVP